MNPTTTDKPDTKLDNNEKSNQERKVQEPQIDPKLPEKKAPSVKETEEPKKTNAEPDSE